MCMGQDLGACVLLTQIPSASLCVCLSSHLKIKGNLLFLSDLPLHLKCLVFKSLSQRSQLPEPLGSPRWK